MLSDFAKNENCIIGVCDGLPIPYFPGNIPFVSSDPRRRSDPSAILPGVKSIIVVGVPYEIAPSSPVPEDAGILSALGVVGDYHITVKSLLKKLVARLQQQISFKYKIQVDSPNLDERAIAIKAGLGYIGRNGLVISKEYGSRFNIGLLLMDIEQAFTQKNKSHSCLPDCRNCVDACPTGALSDRMNVNRCISYLTQKENLTTEEEALIGLHLYGCDICQNACLHNQPTPIYWANPKEWISMPDTQFKEKYGHTAMMWRGADLLRRNAKVALASQDQLQN